MRERKVDALLFDKDGTLFDFHKSWSRWAADLIEDLCAGDPALRARLADAMHFDIEGARFLETSPVIACTNREVAECVALGLGRADVDAIETKLMRSAAIAPQAPVVPLGPLFEDFASRNLKIGLMTNDAEIVARAHLDNAGIASHFDLVIGFDSGHGAKPAPDPLLVFARAVAVPPARVAMVGDSTHDLMAGRAAGMQTIAVLTGTAQAQDLAPYADTVLPDIGHIPGWLTS